MIEEIKKIPLATFLSQLGYEPAYRRGNGLWYRSPLRQENTPSFKVQLDKNTWYDFGIAKGGTIIDLAAELYHSEDIRYLMDCIVKCCPVPSAQTVASSYAPRHYAPSFENIKNRAIGKSRTSRLPQRAGYPGTHRQGELQGGSLHPQWQTVFCCGIPEYIQRS